MGSILTTKAGHVSKEVRLCSSDLQAEVTRKHNLDKNKTKKEEAHVPGSKTAMQPK